jgi:hypothetical protein
MSPVRDKTRRAQTGAAAPSNAKLDDLPRGADG